MGLVGNFYDGFAYTSGSVFKYQGAYTSLPCRPQVCDKCARTSGGFHAHGRYKRSLTTVHRQSISRIKVWRHRWLCLCCGRTMNNGTADVLAHVPNCTLVIVALLWAYFQNESGYYNQCGHYLDKAAAPRTLARYLKRAKAVCRTTQQAIRQVLIERSEPRPWDQGFAHGLSPPGWLIKRHRDPDSTGILWRALAMLNIGANKLLIAPCLLMARAKKISETQNIRFLL
jgi:hypothetical protein